MQTDAMHVLHRIQRVSIHYEAQVVVSFNQGQNTFNAAIILYYMAQKWEIAPKNSHDSIFTELNASHFVCVFMAPAVHNVLIITMNA